MSATDILARIFLVFFLLIAMAIFSVAVAFYYVYHSRNSKREERSIASLLLLVRVPRTNEIKIDAMEQMIAALYSIKQGGWKMRFDTQPVISFEIVAKNQEIKFYIWTHDVFRELVERQIHGAYPDAEVTLAEEHDIFSHGGKVAYKSFQLKSEIYKPLKSFKELPTDPMSAITAALAKMQPDEAAAIQILISPTESGWSKLGRGYISATKKAESDPEKASYNTNPKELEAIENKVSKPGFEVSIRMIVVAQTDVQADSHLTNLVSAFSQFNGEFNSLKSRKIRRKGAFVEDFIYRYHPMFNVFGNQGMILNAEEIATIFHFPNKLITTPHIDWLTAKSAPAPAQVPDQLPMEGGVLIGNSTFRGQKRPVYVAKEDRLRHFYIIGKTGTGKSKFLLELMKQDIKAGNGLCFIDPHGDAAEDLLQFVPPERAEDVIYFRPSDTERPMGLNLLEANTEEEKHFVAGSVINMMYKLFDPYKTGIVGPRFEHAVRNAILTILVDPGATFIEIIRILTDSEYVKELLPKLQDPIVRRYWTDQMAQTSDFHKSEVLDYITSKFGRFVTNKMVRNIIGQSESSFDFRKVMDEQKILIVNLSKGEMGEENSSFLGLIIVPRILMAAMSRADIPEADRKDFYLYVDEFQNFATPDFAQILSEARKFRLGLVVANQFISQIDEEIKNAIFGNIGTQISYRVGVDDASYLTRQFAPTFNEEDLQNIEKYHVYMKTIVGNEPVLPFSVDLTKDYNEIKKAKNPQLAEVIREMSRLQYGRDAKLVEVEMTRRAKL